MPQYYRRKAYEEMLRWKREYAPQYALSLRGARRGGKTTLAEKLGREQYRSYIYLMDTGLLVSLAYRDRPYLENELYKAILLDKLHVNEGMIVENATAQALRASGYRAFFYRETDKKPGVRSWRWTSS